MKTFLGALALSGLLVSATALAEQPYDTIEQALTAAEYANAMADKMNAEAELAEWQKKMDELN